MILLADFHSPNDERAGGTIASIEHASI